MTAHSVLHCISEWKYNLILHKCYRGFGKEDHNLCVNLSTMDIIDRQINLLQCALVHYQTLNADGKTTFCNNDDKKHKEWKKNGEWPLAIRNIQYNKGAFYIYASQKFKELAHLIVYHKLSRLIDFHLAKNQSSDAIKCKIEMWNTLKWWQWALVK